jgi:hypothetical protein
MFENLIYVVSFATALVVIGLIMAWGQADKLDAAFRAFICLLVGGLFAWVLMTEGRSATELPISVIITAILLGLVVIAGCAQSFIRLRSCPPSGDHQGNEDGSPKHKGDRRSNLTDDSPLF